MNPSGFDSRITEIRNIHREYTHLYRIGSGVSLVLLGIGVGALVFTENGLDYRTNLYTEFISIAITVFVLNALTRRREEARERTRLKTDLIARLHSSVHADVLRAIEELRRHDWLEDGTLRGLDLPKANFQVADLNGADLRDTNFAQSDFQGATLVDARLTNSCLWVSNLQETDLRGVKLENAEMIQSDLNGAILNDAVLDNVDLSFGNLSWARMFWVKARHAQFVNCNMTNANLSHANLHGALLMHANLTDADLTNANLEKAGLQGTVFGANTRLPDGTCWHPAVDLHRFTDRNHPDFWRPVPDAIGNLPPWFDG